jgi:hypothetical protein
MDGEMFDLDLVSRAEKRGYWIAVEAALYCGQIHGMLVPQDFVDNVWRSRDGEKPPLEAFVVEDLKPVLRIGITCESIDEWIEGYQPRLVRRTKNPPPPRPAGCLTVAEVARRLESTRKEVYRLVYVAGEIPSQEYATVDYNRWEFPLRCVNGEALEKWIEDNHK